MSTELDDLIKRAELLSTEDRLKLIEHLVTNPPTTVRRQWREIKGVAPYPLLGEDAQSWLSRKRREGDRHRESTVRNGDK